MAKIVAEHITKRFGSRSVLHDVNLTLAGSHFAIITGVSGCGKSTLLRILAGLERPTSGEVRVDDKVIHKIPMAQRRLSLVSQNFALYPHFTVFKNIAYPMQIRREPRDKIKKTVTGIAETLGIEDILSHMPNAISGGQKQRVAIARGLVKDADVYILDDPLVGLDYKVRENVARELQDLQERVEALFVYATSDPLEPLLLGHSIAILDAGHIIEHDSPRQLYSRPHYLTTFKNLGVPALNVIAGQVRRDRGEVVCDTPWATLPLRDYSGPDTAVTLAFRAEDMMLEEVQDQTTQSISFQCIVLFAEEIGSETIVYVESHDIQLKAIVFNRDREFPSGSSVTVRIFLDRLRVYNPSGTLIEGGFAVEHN